jgi:hypothetical protein
MLHVTIELTRRLYMIEGSTPKETGNEFQQPWIPPTEGITAVPSAGGGSGEIAPPDTGTEIVFDYVDPDYIHTLLAETRVEWKDGLRLEEARAAYPADGPDDGEPLDLSAHQYTQLPDQPLYPAGLTKAEGYSAPGVADKEALVYGLLPVEEVGLVGDFLGVSDHIAATAIEATGYEWSGLLDRWNDDDNGSTVGQRITTELERIQAEGDDATQ